MREELRRPSALRRRVRFISLASPPPPLSPSQFYSSHRYWNTVSSFLMSAPSTPPSPLLLPHPEPFPCRFAIGFFGVFMVFSLHRRQSHCLRCNAVPSPSSLSLSSLIRPCATTSPPVSASPTWYPTPNFTTVYAFTPCVPPGPLHRGSRKHGLPRHTPPRVAAGDVHTLPPPDLRMCCRHACRTRVHICCIFFLTSCQITFSFSLTRLPYALLLTAFCCPRPTSFQ